jgi:hypothetical protein
MGVRLDNTPVLVRTVGTPQKPLIANANRAPEAVAAAVHVAPMVRGTSGSCAFNCVAWLRWQTRVNVAATTRKAAV